MDPTEVREIDNPLITREARAYSLRQLAHRAGVENDWLRTWRIEHWPDRTIVYPLSDQPECQVIFRHAPPEHWEHIRHGFKPVQHVKRTNGQANGGPPDYVLPFLEDGRLETLFLMRCTTAECRTDILASIVLTLSRYEETLPGPRDSHGRFPATASLSVTHGFADRPTVDELGVAFREVLTHICPAWRPAKRSLRVHLTHDVDEIGIPPRLRKVAKHAVRSGARSAVRDLISLGGGRPAALTSVLDTVLIALSHRLRCAVFWKASSPGDFDSGYEITDSRVAEVICALREARIELGVHPGYDTFLNSQLLRDEVTRITQMLSPDHPIGGRQHFLRWSPEMWREWERCGLSYDSSVGFSERIGFRAGTCHPYAPWFLSENREGRILEIPLIAMDCALTGPMRLRDENCIEALLQVANTCRSYGGVFTLLWHTDSILDPMYRDVYKRVVENLAGESNYDWQADRCLVAA